MKRPNKMVEQTRCKTNKTIQKYLSYYAEPQISQLHTWTLSLQTPYAQALVIPLFKETRSPTDIWLAASEAFHQAHPGMGKILVILIFNAPTNAHETEICCTESTLINLNQKRKLCYSDAPFQFSQHSYYDLLTVNLIKPGICPKQGVGYARKFGADIACSLYHHQKIAHPFLSCTDADVTLPIDYFAYDQEQKPADRANAIASATYSALIHPYSHITSHAQPGVTESEEPPKQKAFVQNPTNTLNIAHSYYELYLRHLTANLALSRSPYAYQTIGSLMKINLKAYAQVRGFPKRAAGEDFYLLNKLAKVGQIKELNRQPIQITPRLSNRTPFGTGPRIAELLAFSAKTGHNTAGVKSSTEFIDFLKSKPYFYAPSSFNWLEAFISTVEDLGDEQKIAERLVHLTIPEALFQFVYPGLKNCSRISKDKAGFVKHFHQWFDGFRTIKWLNIASNYFQKVPINEAFNPSWLEKFHHFSNKRTVFRNNAVEINRLLSKLERQ